MFLLMVAFPCDLISFRALVLIIVRELPLQNQIPDTTVELALRISISHFALELSLKVSYRNFCSQNLLGLFFRIF